MIPHGRWAVVIVQFPLLAAVGMGAPLKLAALIFSVTFPMFYAGICFLNGYLLRSHRASWIPLGLLAFSSPTLFFWPVSELMQGLAVLSVLIAITDSNSRIVASARLKEVCCAMICIFALMFHIGTYPIILILLAFLWLDAKINLRNVWICLGVATAYLLIKLTNGLDDYEANRLALNGSLLEWSYLPRLVRNFSSGLFFITFGLFLIIRRKDKSKSTAFALVAALGSIALINLFFPAADKYFYYDNLYLIPLFIVLVVLSFLWHRRGRNRWRAFFKYKRTVIAVFLFVFLRIAIDVGDYSERQAIGRECCGRCIELGARTIDGKAGNWSLGAETLVLSSLCGRTGIAWTSEARRQSGVQNNSDSLIIASWIALSPKDLNRSYYRIDLSE